MIKRFFNKIGEIVTLFPQRQRFLLIIIAGVISLIIQIYTYSAETPAAPSTNCVTLKDAITQQIAGAAHCKTNADCVTASFNCPFNCSVALNKSADHVPLIKNIESYNNSCGFCVDSCAPAPPPACVNNHCQIAPTSN